MHFILLLEVNFGSDVLVRFQKAVMDNANSGTSDGRYKLLLVPFLKEFGCFVMIKALNRSFPFVKDDSFPIKNSLSEQKMDHLNLADATSDTLPDFGLFGFP